MDKCKNINKLIKNGTISTPTFMGKEITLLYIKKGKGMFTLHYQCEMPITTSQYHNIHKIVYELCVRLLNIYNIPIYMGGVKFNTINFSKEEEYQFEDVILKHGGEMFG